MTTARLDMCEHCLDDVLTHSCRQSEMSNHRYYTENYIFQGLYLIYQREEDVTKLKSALLS